MNFLGHIVLARDSADSRVGNFLGDFVKGLPITFSSKFGAEVVDGILMHRAVDVFTDSHPAFLKARDLLSPQRRRFAGILVDIFFDHFLSLQWQEIMGAGRREFIDNFYSELQSYEHIVEVEEMSEIAALMADQDWLGCYVTLDGMALTIRRVASRSVRFAPMLGGADDLVKNFAEFQKCFEEFFPDVQRFVKEWQHGRPLRIP